MITNDFDEDIEIIRYKRYIPKVYLDYVLKPYIDILRLKKIFKFLSKKYKINNVISRSPETAVASIKFGFKTSYLVPGIVKTQNFVKVKSIFDVKSFFLNVIVISPIVFFQKKALLGSNQVFVFSHNMKNQLFSFLKKKINTKKVNPGVDSLKFNKTKKINKKSFVFLIVGRLIKDKGIDLAITSLAKLKDNKTILLIIGDGPERNILEKLSIDLNVQERIIFKGKITENIETYYQNSDCLLMSSRMETFGQTILEALSVGLPIIGWKSSSIIKTATSEIIENKKNGYLIDFEPDAMSNAMLKILSLSDKELEIIKNNNYNLAREKYVWGKLSNDLIKL